MGNNLVKLFCVDTEVTAGGAVVKLKISFARATGGKEEKHPGNKNYYFWMFRVTDLAFLGKIVSCLSMFYCRT